MKSNNTELDAYQGDESEVEQEQDHQLSHRPCIGTCRAPNFCTGDDSLEAIFDG